jgi:hypothetical protein
MKANFRLSQFRIAECGSRIFQWQVRRRLAFSAEIIFISALILVTRCANFGDVFSLCGLLKLHNGALFLAGNVGAETHVMNDHVPLRVTIHGGRPNVVTTHTIVGPKLFAA